MALTEKMKRFCDEYLIDLNATQAAIRAGYSKKTARAIGQENLTKLDVQEYLKKRMDEKEKKLIASQDEVLKYLTKVMRREEKETVVVVTSRETATWVKNEETGKPQKQAIKEQIPETVEIPTKVSDSNKAAELLGKRYGIFSDKIDINGVIPVVITDESELED